MIYILYLITAATLGFEFMSYTVVESVGSANVCVVLTGEIERNITVRIFTPNPSSGKGSLH